MNSRPLVLVLFICMCLGVQQRVVGQSSPGRGGRLNNLKVLSSNIDDVTTVESILKSFAKPTMSDAERSKALWTAAVRYRHQTAPPNEFLADEWEAHDPVKIFNVYGYCMCCCTSSILQALNRLDGRETRGRILTGHSVPEVKYDNAWHMFDCSLITYFPKPGSGEVASVDEISQAVKHWYSANPDYRGNAQKLHQFMRDSDWAGWKRGPELLANSPFYSSAYLPARTHGWDATMIEYDRNSEIYEYGYQVGHRALFSLRPGESFVREAGNRGLHVNMAADPKWDVLKQKAPEGDLVYLKDFLPKYNGSVVGNGFHRYSPDLPSGGLAAGAERYENLTTGSSPALQLKTSGKPGIAVVQMASPYVYLGGRIRLKAMRKGAADQVRLSISTNNGRTFSPLWQADRTGEIDADIRLEERVLRRYAYWLKLEIVSSTPRGAGINALVIENDIQHAPRTLPWLAAGSNKITVASEGGVNTATRAVSCRITGDTSFKKNETTSAMGVSFSNMDVRDGSCWWKGGTGAMTVPIETPGDITALRFGGQFRARGERDQIRMAVSFDDGRSWTEAAKVSGPTPGITQYFRYSAVPPGTKKALLRYELTGQNTVGIFSFRADADYRDPKAASMRPFYVVHRWKENGQEKSRREMVRSLPHSYTIEAGADPEMVSVSYEMPAK